MSQPPTDPPAPGDPRSPGPRPAAGPTDVAWAALAVLLIAVTAVQLARVAYRAATDPDVVTGGGPLVLAFIVTVVWLLTIYWLSVGSWRRTVWGCPFEHRHQAPAARRCQRHPLLDESGAPTGDGTAPGGPDTSP